MIGSERTLNVFQSNSSRICKDPFACLDRLRFKTEKLSVLQVHFKLKMHKLQSEATNFQECQASKYPLNVIQPS